MSKHFPQFQAASLLETTLIASPGNEQFLSLKAAKWQELGSEGGQFRSLLDYPRDVDHG